MMMKICTILFLLLLQMHFSKAQESAAKIPMHDYKFSKEIAEELSEGKLKLTKASQYYSYIGEYQKALSVPHEIPLAWGFDTLTQDDKVYFEKFTAVDAVEAIVQQAQKERIVILNEAHQKPLHRVFARKLLQGLYDHGYRYFGLEALSNCAYVPKAYCDTLLNERGYPLNSPLSGTYVREPQMSNLIREAYQIGFTLFAYERFGQDRERDQAAYIAAVSDRDPEAKILILCGWYHLLEAAHKDKEWMGFHLKEKTGIDPFTIYQDILIERNSTQESPFFTMMDFEEEKLFVNESGKFYNGRKGFELFDALIYHPRTKYIKNRPHWLVNLDQHFLYEVENIRIQYPCLIKAYRKEESNEAVPIDIIEKEYELDPTVLVLPKGDYRLEISNLNKEMQIQKISID